MFQRVFIGIMALASLYACAAVGDEHTFELKWQPNGFRQTIRAEMG